jgi:3',5'-cyclic AMP phosphodiesterase CpdA
MPTIAHLSDVHLSPISGFTPRYWSVKRALGYANWLHGRRTSFARAALARITADIMAASPDHIAVTGDLVNIGLPGEHIAALAWLETLGPPQRVSVVPGNHDVYQRLRNDRGADRWASYMTSDTAHDIAGLHAAHCAVARVGGRRDGAGIGSEDAPGGAPGDGPRFPFLRRIGPVAIIGLNSAIPTPPLIASGRVGSSQRARLAEMLTMLGREGAFRMVLVHHPPLPGQARRTRALEDAPELAGVLAECGAELVVHGHNHESSLVWCGGKRRVPVVGVPAAALAQAHGAACGRHNLYRISGPPWRIEIVGRGLTAEGEMVDVERHLLEPGQ